MSRAYSLRHRTPGKVFPVTGVKKGFIWQTGPAARNTARPGQIRQLHRKNDAASLFRAGPGGLDVGQRYRFDVNAQGPRGSHRK